MGARKDEAKEKHIADQHVGGMMALGVQGTS